MCVSFKYVQCKKMSRLLLLSYFRVKISEKYFNKDILFETLSFKNQSSVIKLVLLVKHKTKMYSVEPLKAIVLR